LGTRRGELAALAVADCDLKNDTFQIEHSYYWRVWHSEEHEIRSLAKPLSMHPALKHALLEWKTQSHRNRPRISCSPSRLYGGRKALESGGGLKKKIRPAFDKLGSSRGWHTFGIRRNGAG